MRETNKKFEHSRSDFEKPLIQIEYEGYPPFAYERIRSLIERLAAEYPNKNFKFLDWINLHPFKGNDDLAAYTALDGEKEVGIAIGNKKPENFKIRLFVIDPKYQNGQVAKQILNQVFSSNHTVTLKAAEFGGRQALNEQQRARRQQSLIAYYEKLGFNRDTSNPDYQSSAESDKPLMIWEKKTN